MDEHEVTKRLATQHSIMETKISRKLIEEHAPFNQLKRWVALAILFVLTVIVIALLFLFSTTPERIFVVKTKTNAGVENYSKLYGYPALTAVSTTDSQMHNSGILAQGGDLLYMQNCCLRFLPAQESLEIVEQGNSLTYMDGKIAGINLETNTESIAWLDRLTADSLQQLRSLFIDLPIQQRYLPYLKKISAEHKNISLTITNTTDTITSSYVDDLTTLSRLFTPEYLGIALSAKSLRVLQHFSSVQSIMIVLDDQDSIRQLPLLPNLRECIVLTSDGSYISHQLFKNNSSLEKLSISPSDSVFLSLDLIKGLPHLKQLVTGQLVYFDIDSLHKVAPGLTTLIVADSCKNISTLAKFKELKWLGLPPTTSQSEFEGIINGLPQLEVLEMCGGDSIKKLGAIEKLKDLKGLVIANELPDSSRLFALKQLRYLSIPEESYKDSLFRHKLVKALPGCIIVPNAGACLGSGWLLLLIPLVTVIIYFRKKIVNVTRQL